MTTNLLAIDPGKRNGLSIWDWETGKHYKAWAFTLDETLAYLETVNGLSAIVVEDFISRGSVTRGSRNEASQVIGAAKSAAIRLGVPYIAQRPESRLIGARWAGIRVPKGHMKDEDSAYLHGVYYLRQQGKFKTALEKKLGK